jgi:hypothetical protein
MYTGDSGAYTHVRTSSHQITGPSSNHMIAAARPNFGGPPRYMQYAVRIGWIFVCNQLDMTYDKTRDERASSKYIEGQDTLAARSIALQHMLFQYFFFFTLSSDDLLGLPFSLTEHDTRRPWNGLEPSRGLLYSPCNLRNVDSSSTTNLGTGRSPPSPIQIPRAQFLAKGDCPQNCIP